VSTTLNPTGSAKAVVQGEWKKRRKLGERTGFPTWFARPRPQTAPNHSVKNPHSHAQRPNALCDTIVPPMLEKLPFNRDGGELQFFPGGTMVSHSALGR